MSSRRFELVRAALKDLPADLCDDHAESVLAVVRATLRRRLPSTRAELAETLGVTSAQARVLMSVLAGMTVAKAVEELAASGEPTVRSTGTRWMSTSAGRIATWVAERETRPAGFDDYLRNHETRCGYIDPRGMRRTVHSQDLVLPLTDVYIAVRLGPESAEVAADLDLTISDLGPASLQDRLLDDLLAFEEPDTGPTRHFAHLIQDRRWIVVLGDPGAGKTTLLNWLALKNAQALRAGAERVVVDGRHLGLEDAGPVDLGPARLPVLFRVAEYADELKRAHAADQPAPNISDFLGRHTVGDESLPGDAEDHAKLIRSYMDRGEAIILADGLDEITDLRLRRSVASRLESFAREHVVDPVEPGAFLPLPDQRAWWTVTPSRPAADGGNQLVVTSRIAGFKEAPLAGAFAITKILPLEDEAVRRFADDWCLAVEHFRARSAPQSEAGITARATEAARSLTEAIFGEPRIRKLAANPLLLTVLALLQRERGRMPTRRVDLYEEATRVLVERRQPQEWSFEEVIDILGPFALWLQENSNTGHAGEGELREHIRDGLTRVTETVAESYVEGFVRSAREQTGLLVEVGVGRYGFLHGTFREYLAAHEVTRSQQRFEEVVSRFLHSPRWVEVLSLGVAITSKERPDDADNVVKLILDKSSPFEDLLHRDLAFAASCLHEMVRVTPALAGGIVTKLFDAAAWAERRKFERLRRQLVDILVELSASRPRATEPRLFEALRSADTAGVAAAVASRQERPTVDLLDAVQAMCNLPNHPPAALSIRIEIATALFQEGALTDTAFEPIKTLIERHEHCLADLAETSSDLVKLIRRTSTSVDPALRECFQWLLEHAFPRSNGDRSALSARFVEELLRRSSRAKGLELVTLWTAARMISPGRANAWLLDSYSSGLVDIDSAARCIARRSDVLPSDSALSQWFEKLPEPAQISLIEYQTFTGASSPLVPIAWAYAIMDGAIGSAARAMLFDRTTASSGLSASEAAFQALHTMLTEGSAEIAAAAQALLPRLRVSLDTNLADLRRTAAGAHGRLCAQQAAILLSRFDEPLSPAEYDVVAAAVVDPVGVLRANAIAALPRWRGAKAVDDAALRRSWHHRAERISAGDGAGSSAHAQFGSLVRHDDVTRFLRLLKGIPDGVEAGEPTPSAVNELLRRARRLAPETRDRSLTACCKITRHGRASGADLTRLELLCRSLSGGPLVAAVRLLGAEAALTGSWAEAGRAFDRLLGTGDITAAVALVHASTWRLREGDQKVTAGILTAVESLQHHTTSGDDSRAVAGVSLLVECVMTDSDSELTSVGWTSGAREAAAAVIDALTTDNDWSFPVPPNSLQTRLARLSAHLGAHARGMRAIVDEVVSALEADRKDWPRRRAALFVAETAAAAAPARFLQTATASNLRERLLAITDDALSHTVRLLSISVLSYFRRLDSAMLSAIARACQDSAVVTTSVLQRCQSIVIEDEPGIEEIAMLLDSRNTPMVGAAALLLAGLARSPDTSTAHRAAAEEALAAAIRSENPAGDLMGVRSLLHDLLIDLARGTDPPNVARLVRSMITNVSTQASVTTAAAKSSSAELVQAVSRTPRQEGLSSASSVPLKEQGGQASWAELGLGDVDGPQLAHLEHVMESVLQLRVGATVTKRLTDEEVREFGAFNLPDDEKKAQAWLIAAVPDHSNVVRTHRADLFAELARSLPEIRRALSELFGG